MKKLTHYAVFGNNAKKRKLRINWKKLIFYYGYGFGVAYSLVILITFFNAYFSPTKCTRVCIDIFHEANVEAIIVPITVALVILGLYIMLRYPDDI